MILFKMPRLHTLGALFIAITLLFPGICQAEDASEAWRKLQTWMKEKQPAKPTRSSLKKFHKSAIKKYKAFIAEHEDFSDLPTAERFLADLYIGVSDFSKALALSNDMAKSDGDRGIIGRVYVVKTLLAQGKVAPARKRLDGFLETHPNEESLLELDSALQDMDKRKRKKAAFKKLKRRAPFPSFAGKRMDNGETWDLSKHKGKVTLIGFWVAMNKGKVNKIGLEELSTANTLYENYKDDGLVVLGVPFDYDQDMLASFVEKHGIKWPQLRDGAGIINDLGVSPLPYWVVLDSDGKVLAKALRGKKLSLAVQEAMKHH